MKDGRSFKQYISDGPPQAINGVTWGPYKWSYRWETGIQPVSGVIIEFFELVGAHLVVIHQKTGEYSKKANLPTGSMYVVYLPIYFP